MGRIWISSIGGVITLLAGFETFLLFGGGWVLVGETYLPFVEQAQELVAVDEDTGTVSSAPPPPAARWECTYFTGRKMIKLDGFPEAQYYECPFYIKK
jgi:hypothetical protein